MFWGKKKKEKDDSWKQEINDLIFYKLMTIDPKSNKKLTELLEDLTKNGTANFVEDMEIALGLTAVANLMKLPIHIETNLDFDAAEAMVRYIHMLPKSVQESELVDLEFPGVYTAASSVAESVCFTFLKLFPDTRELATFIELEHVNPYVDEYLGVANN